MDTLPAVSGRGTRAIEPPSLAKSIQHHQDLTEAEPFTKAERLALWLVAAAFVVPFNIFDYRIFATEIATCVFIAAGRRRGIELWRVVPLLLLLGVTVAFAFLFPSSNYSRVISVGVYAKILVYVCFVYILVQRCNNRENIAWLAKRVLAVALVLSISALADRYTDWTFFVDWRRTFYWTTLVEERMLDTYGLDLLDSVTQNSGLAPRTMDIIPWALMGMTAAYWLHRTDRMKGTILATIFIVLTGAAFSMPKRSAVVTLGAGLLAFLLFGQREASWRTRIILLLLTVVSVLGVTQAGRFYDTLGGSESKVETNTALSRFLYAGFTGGYDFADSRVILEPQEIDFLLHNPRELLLGTGWIFAGGVWVKPHNTYIGLVIGGGLVSALALAVALVHLFRDSLDRQNRYRTGALGLVLLVSLSVELVVNGYLSGRLEYLASILVMWIAWSAIMYRNPPVAEERTEKNQL